MESSTSTSTFPKIEYAIFDMDGLLSKSPPHPRRTSQTLPHFEADVRAGCSWSGWFLLDSLFLDETVDSERIYTDVTNIILGRYGYVFDWETKSKVMGCPARVSAEIVLSSYNLLDKLTVDEYIAEHERLRDARFRVVQPMRGALGLVRHLHENGVPIAVATGSAYDSFLIKTSHLPHMFDLFPADLIVTANSPEMKPGRGKPCPDVFLAAARRLGRKVGMEEEPASQEERAERRKGLVFEDAVLGAQAGVRAGMNVVWVPDESLRALNPEATHGASVVIEHLEEFKPEQWGLPALT